MLPVADCKKCPLSKTRKAIVGSSGPIPAQVLIIVDAINSTDEIFNKPHSGPDERVLENLLEEAGEIAGVGKLSIHIASVTMCRAHTAGVDRAPTRSEILNCASNVIQIADACQPKVVILVGEVAKTYYASEFEEAVTIQPSWFLRKHPAYWINAVSAIAEGLRKCL